MANKCYDIIKILSSNKLTNDKNNYISCTVTLLIKANFIYYIYWLYEWQSGINMATYELYLKNHSFLINRC